MEILARDWPLLAALIAIISPILLAMRQLYESIIADCNERNDALQARNDLLVDMLLDLDNQADRAVIAGEAINRRSLRRS